MSKIKTEIRQVLDDSTQTITIEFTIHPLLSLVVTEEMLHDEQFPQWINEAGQRNLAKLVRQWSDEILGER